VADTARFRHADGATLRTAARLVELSGSSVEDALALLDRDEEEVGNLDARRAALAAASRASVETVGASLVAVSQVGSFDAAAAAALVRAGADLAVVARERGGEARVSLRASPRALAGGLRLGELANEAAREVGWSGGGHDAAAGLRGEPPAARAVEALVRRARERLRGAP
jgi:nanoRNase/pAp phosphatase (c-di-AMP/oligoRNAs hydrolase)